MEPSNVVLLYLFRYCIICIDKILPGECVNRKFSLHIAQQQQQQQQHSLFSQASWDRLEMKPERCKFYKIEAKKKVNTNAKIYAY